MPLGPGKYDKELKKLLKLCGANEGLIIIFDGNQGPSFCANLKKENIIAMPKMLRYVADEVENRSKT